MIPYNCIQQLKDYDEKKMKFPCIGQVKMDGIFGRWDPDTKRFYTRSGHEIQGLRVLEHEMSLLPDPYDGELVIPGQGFFTMNGLIRSFNETPTCLFYIFDEPGDETYEYRQKFYFNHETLKSLPHVKLMQAHTIKNQVDAELFYAKVLRAGHEGIVYKSLSGHYKDGKHWDNMKRVPVKTCECKIISAYEGLGKLKGTLGGFVVDFNGVKVKVGGGPGVDYPVRHYYWENREDAIGQPMKCQYKKLTPKGSMRSPQMLGIRWDI